jgi:hypothetical protein
MARAGGRREVGLAAVDAPDPPPPSVPQEPAPVARNFSSAKYTASDYLFQFITITAGVLIALLVNGLVEARNNRNLVRDARATIAREIADNRDDLDKTLANYDADARALEQAIKFATDMLTTRTTKVNQLRLHINLADLSSTSWRTAERTGALSHMDYAEVQKYSKLYDLQDLFVEQQRSMVSRLAAATAILSSDFDADNPNPKDLETFREQVMLMRAALKVQEEFARRLAENYAEGVKP